MRLTAIVDIGAAPIDGAVSYAHMLKAGVCTVIGFEPQAEMLDILRKRAGPNETYRSEVIADGTRRTLYVASNLGMTSLMETDQKIQRLYGMNDYTVTPVEVQTARLDDLHLSCDFLRMDVQGTEGMILDHAHETLKETVAIQLEVSFIPTYRGQLPFGAMDLKLRALGFVPHRFLDAKSAFLVGATVRIPNQILEADIIYIRDPASDMTAEQLHHLANLAHYVFGSVDLRQHCLSRLNLREVA